VVRIHSPRPNLSMTYRRQARKRATHLPTHIALPGASKVRILRSWQRTLPSLSIPANRIRPARTCLTDLSISMSCIALGRSVDRFLTCAAYWIIASRYHTGQWSKGYAKLSQLSRMGYNPGLASEPWVKLRMKSVNPRVLTSLGKGFALEVPEGIWESEEARSQKARRAIESNGLATQREQNSRCRPHNGN
jgi:hypothetical protein